jgi:hypothetical protein
MAIKGMKAKKPKGLKRRPRKLKKESLLGKVVVLDGKREIDKRTGMNRDIPMGGAGGSSNLMSNLVGRGLAVGPPQPSIQTPDQFKLAQDITAIKTQQADIKQEQAGIAEEIAIQKKERKERSDKGKPRPRGEKINMATENMPEEAIPTGADTFVTMPKSAGGKAKAKVARQSVPLQGQVAMTQPAMPIPTPIPYNSTQAPLAPQPKPFATSLVGEDGGGIDEIMGDGLGQPTM